MTFVSSGDLGDACYALPVIRYKGGGILYLRAANFTRARMTWDHAQALIPLLRAQPYIEDVREWNGEHCDLDLDCFRAPMFAALRKDVNSAKGVGLWQWYSRVFGVPENEWKQWIAIPEPGMLRFASVVVNRSSRYHNPRFDWQRVAEKYPRATIIGHPEEAQPLSDLSKWWTWHKTENLLQAAMVIEQAKLFIGNQSACLAICEGLKKPAISEVFAPMPNCLFHREHCWHGWDENVFLPDLRDLP